ncbi:GNAT family N-acetyltransferase [Naumannella sp. ID2617S]|nr:GNAT family N-acetyltransferase [Naumannella sp. ID2617S]
MEVRAAEPVEYAAVGELCVQAYQPSGMPPEQEYWRMLRDVAGRAAGSEVWVAVDADGSLLGTVTWCGPGSPHRQISRDGEAEFRMLAVAPAAQGRGVGGLLLAAVLDRARADGCSAVVLCSAGWMTAAHRMYARAGFRRTPELDWTPAPGIHLQSFRLAL